MLVTITLLHKKSELLGRSDLFWGVGARGEYEEAMLEAASPSPSFQPTIWALHSSLCPKLACRQSDLVTSAGQASPYLAGF